MFRLMRFYAVASFIVIFLAAALLTLFYRQVTIHWINHLAETNNLAMAQTALNSIKPELLAYLDSNTAPGSLSNAPQQLSDKLATDIHRLAQENSMDRIAIYNRDGKLLLSTKSGTISSDQSENPDFQSALSGRDSSSMIYRDLLNRFEGKTAEDNLMRTFITVRNSPTGPVLGIFEIHTDLSQMVQENNRHFFIVLTGAECILALLYIVLIVVVRHAENIIESQHKTTEERTTSLEILSKRLLKIEEQRKQKIAIDLHEGLAQTLSALKINVESGNERIKAHDANTESLEAIVPVIQSAIQEVRSIATELRPSSLDDLGLLPTINWFCREFEKQHAEINIKREISLHEATIPAPLKIVIYRIIESTFKNIAHHSSTDQIKLAMQQADSTIHLRISHAPFESDTNSWPKSPDSQFRFTEMKERASLSGGTFTATRNNAGWLTLHASWEC